MFNSTPVSFWPVSAADRGPRFSPVGHTDRGWVCFLAGPWCWLLPDRAPHSPCPSSPSASAWSKEPENVLWPRTTSIELRNQWQQPLPLQAGGPLSPSDDTRSAARPQTPGESEWRLEATGRAAWPGGGSSSWTCASVEQTKRSWIRGDLPEASESPSVERWEVPVSAHYPLPSDQLSSISWVRTCVMLSHDRTTWAPREHHKIELTKVFANEVLCSYHVLCAGVLVDFKKHIFWYALWSRSAQKFNRFFPDPYFICPVVLVKSC